MNPLTPELGKAPLAPPKPRTGVLTREIVHNTRHDDRELESKKKWGYYQLTGELSQNINPDSAPCKPYYVRFYPFVCTRKLSNGDGHFDFYYRACAVVAYVDPYDCEVGDFYKRFEFTREHTLELQKNTPLGLVRVTDDPDRDKDNQYKRFGVDTMRFEKKVYRLVTPDDYEEFELWERVS